MDEKERIAVVTPEESQLFRDLEATPTYEISPQNMYRDSDPRLLPGDVISYAANVILSAEALLTYHHGTPPVLKAKVRRLFSPPESPSSNREYYTINDLVADKALQKPPILMETEHSSLPSSKFSVTPSQYLLDFARSLRQQPTLDEASLENQLIYNTVSVRASDAAIVTERSGTARDALAISLAALLRLQQLSDQVARDKGYYSDDGFIPLPTQLTTTSRHIMSGVESKHIHHLPHHSFDRLRFAILEASQKKASDT
jgi:hypothetical protein